jgi:CBS domain-containing protein
MLVNEVLRTKPKSIITAETSTLVSRAMELLLQHRISCLPVLNADRELVGIISDKDIFKLLHERPQAASSQTVSSIMTSDLLVGLPTDEISYIAAIMTNNRIRHIPIMEGKTLVGLLSVGDIVKTLMAHIETENRYLRQYIDGTYPA